MLEKEFTISTGSLRAHWRSAVLWFLFLGMVLALGGNVYQARKAAKFAHDVELRQQSAEHQIAQLKDGLSGVLEQSLARYDELTKQLQSVSVTTLEQARSEAQKRNSQLARTLEQRHEEVVEQLSDLKSDLRQDTASKLGKISSDLQKTGAQLTRVVNQLDVASVQARSAAPAEVKAEPISEHTEDSAPKAPAHKKKQFWSKLNPFHSGKKTADASEDHSEE